MEPRSGYIFCLNRPAGRPPDHLNVWGPISQLLLVRSLPNFKGRFMRPSVTADKCHWEICPCNIFSGHNFFGQEIFFWPTFFWTPIIFQTKFFLPKNILRPQIFFASKFLFRTRIFSNHNFFFGDKTLFLTHDYFYPKFSSGPNIFLHYEFLDLNFCHTWTPWWMFSSAENRASSSLQDEATKWLYHAAWTTHQPTHPTHRISWKSEARLKLKVFCVCLSPTD